MHTLMGVATKDAIVLASDGAAIDYGAGLLTEKHNKESRLGTHLPIVTFGDGSAHFGDYAARNLRLFELRHGYALTPSAAHHWIRKDVCDGLRSRDHVTVDCHFVGWDKDEGAFLGSVDYLGNGLGHQRYVFRGFGGRFIYAIMDREYKKDMTEQATIDLVHKCLNETKKRFVANLSAYNIVVIDKNGRRAWDVKLLQEWPTSWLPSAASGSSSTE